MTYYWNVALIPPACFSKSYIEVSQKFFSAIHSGYCLSAQVCPHVTVTQFTSNDILLPDSLSLAGVNANLQEIQMGGFYAVPHRKNPDLYYCGIEVDKSLEVDQLHRQVLQCLSELNVSLKGKVGDAYWPHFTLGLVKKQYCEVINEIAKADLPEGPLCGWSLVFGQGDAEGQLLKILKEFNAPYR